ncbi:hypothetical protein MMC30_003402 [Trapelia coarctata]|nr:hypothetical protein [Trapelia coarctata]
MAGQPSTPTALQATSQPEPQNGEAQQALKAWWMGFKRKGKRDPPPAAPIVESPAHIFGVDLQSSIKYANVAISLTNEKGESFIYGYVPIVVAKCGVFLKEKATDVEGIFRIAGNNRRIRELQDIFDSPDRYGKGLDWTGYTVHDAANILRRYINHLPQPIIPLNFYERFRNPLRSHQRQAVGDMEVQGQDIGEFDHDRAITTYQQLITELPPLNRQLLLYILDLLSVFASKADVNLMPSANLSAIFQPGLLSHPSHDMSPSEYRLSQDVLIFLIDNQDSFLIGMRGTAADEDTVRDVQNGAKAQQTQQPSTPTSFAAVQANLGRSASNASAGADSLRKFGGIRRNVSVSSKNSKKSSNVPSPITPSSGSAFASNNTGSGVYRSNTVPSKKSPAIPSPRYNKALDSPTSPSVAVISSNQPLYAVHTPSPGSKLAPAVSNERKESASSSITPTAENPMGLSPSLNSTIGNSTIGDQSIDRLLPSESKDLRVPTPAEENQQPINTPSKARGVAGLLNLSPSEAERKESRQPNKLKKKRIPSSTTPSAHSSTNSLHQAPESVYSTPMPTPGYGQVLTDPMAAAAPALYNTAATPQSETGPRFGDAAQDSHISSSELGSKLRPEKSPAPSLHSKSSVTDHSDPDPNEAAAGKSAKKSRWRFSSAKKNGQSAPLAGSAPSQIGSNAIAEKSTSSVGSWRQASKSFTNDTQQTTAEFSVAGPSTTSVQQQSSNESSQKEKGVQEPVEKKGPLGWIKAKVAQAKEERKERESEKERTKSPPRNDADRTESKNSLLAKAQEPVFRGRSMEVNRVEKVSSEAEATPSVPNVNPPP